MYFNSSYALTCLLKTKMDKPTQSFWCVCLCIRHQVCLDSYAEFIWICYSSNQTGIYSDCLQLKTHIIIPINNRFSRCYLVYWERKLYINSTLLLSLKNQAAEDSTLQSVIIIENGFLLQHNPVKSFQISVNFHMHDFIMDMWLWQRDFHEWKPVDVWEVKTTIRKVLCLCGSQPASVWKPPASFDCARLDLCVSLLTERNLLQQVQITGKELAPQRVVQVKGHAVATHGVVRLFPAIPERQVSTFVLKVGWWAAAIIFKWNLHSGCVQPRVTSRVSAVIQFDWAVVKASNALFGTLFLQLLLNPSSWVFNTSLPEFKWSAEIFFIGQYSGHPAKFIDHLLGTLALEKGERWPLSG